MVLSMSIAYVFMETERGKEEELMKALKTRPSVAESHVLYGVYDAVAKIIVNGNKDALEKEILDFRRKYIIEDHLIKSTLTTIAVE